MGHRLDADPAAYTGASVAQVFFTHGGDLRAMSRWG